MSITSTDPDTVPQTRQEFAARAYRYEFSLDKLVLPCGPDQGCDYGACAGWRSEYEDLVGAPYSVEQIAEARAFRESFLADRVVLGEVLG